MDIFVIEIVDADNVHMELLKEFQKKEISKTGLPSKPDSLSKKYFSTSWQRSRDTCNLGKNGVRRMQIRQAVFDDGSKNAAMEPILAPWLKQKYGNML